MKLNFRSICWFYNGLVSSGVTTPESLLALHPVSAPQMEVDDNLTARGRSLDAVTNLLGASRSVMASGSSKTLRKKERRFYQATQLLDQLLAGYDRRLRPGFKGTNSIMVTHVPYMQYFWCIV
jgi:hypothetical protein